MLSCRWCHSSSLWFTSYKRFHSSWGLNTCGLYHSDMWSSDIFCTTRRGINRPLISQRWSKAAYMRGSLCTDLRMIGVSSVDMQICVCIYVLNSKCFIFVRFLKTYRYSLWCKLKSAVVSHKYMFSSQTVIFVYLCCACVLILWCSCTFLTLYVCYNITFFHCCW